MFTYKCLLCDNALIIRDGILVYPSILCTKCDTKYQYFYRNEPTQIIYSYNNYNDKYIITYRFFDNTVICWDTLLGSILYQNEQKMPTIDEAKKLKEKLPNLKIFI